MNFSKQNLILCMVWYKKLKWFVFFWRNLTISPPHLHDHSLNPILLKSSTSLHASNQVPQQSIPSRARGPPPRCPNAPFPRQVILLSKKPTSMCALYEEITKLSRSPMLQGRMPHKHIHSRSSNQCACRHCYVCSSWNNQGSYIHLAHHITRSTPKQAVNIFRIIPKAKSASLTHGVLYIAFFL